MDNKENEYKFIRWWNNLSDQGKLQAVLILLVHTEDNKGDARNYIWKQIEEFDKFFSFPHDNK